MGNVKYLESYLVDYKDNLAHHEKLLAFYERGKDFYQSEYNKTVMMLAYIKGQIKDIEKKLKIEREEDHENR